MAALRRGEGTVAEGVAVQGEGKEIKESKNRREEKWEGKKVEETEGQKGRERGKRGEERAGET